MDGVDNMVSGKTTYGRNVRLFAVLDIFLWWMVQKVAKENVGRRGGWY